VECANLLVLNKMDLIATDDAARLEEILRKLNPKARIVRSIFGKIDPKLLLNTGSFDLKEAERMPGWVQELTGNHVPETLEYNISSFIFRAKRPFHPQRLLLLQSDGSDGILRSKGMIWVADSPEQALVWGQAGVSVRIEAGPLWVHQSMDVSQWPPIIRDRRRQEVVFIGIGMDEVAIRQRLEKAFVTDEENKSNMREWHYCSQTFPLGHLIQRHHRDGCGQSHDAAGHHNGQVTCADHAHGVAYYGHSHGHCH
jgi:G3E family GTPase